MFMSVRDLVANETGFASVNFPLLNEEIWPSVGQNYRISHIAYYLNLVNTTADIISRYHCRY